MKYYLPLLLLLFACATQTVPDNWPQKMQHLGKALSDIMPLIQDDKSFVKDKAVTLKKLKEFKNASLNVKHKNANQLLGKDPIVYYSLSGLKNNLKEAVSLYEKGEYFISQNLVRNSISYCFYCHTRTNYGPQFLVDHFKIDTSMIRSTERKVKALVATRQYKEALDIITQKIYQQKGKTTTRDMKYLKLYVQIAIKSDKKVNEIEAFLQRYQQKHSMPKFMSKVLGAWQKALVYWQKHGSNATNNLFMRLQKGNIASGSDANFVDAIFLSKFLHDDLMIENNRTAQTYYRLGRIYYLYPEIELWDLADSYYSACILESPNSEIAKKCYKDLHESIYLGYTGSSGTMIPQSQKLRLKMLKQKAGL